MKDKKILSLGILSVLWGVLYFCYTMFFPTSAYDLLGSKSLQYSSEQIAQYKEGLQNIIAISDILFIVFLVILMVLLIIKLKKMNIKLSSNGSMILIITGLVLHILGLVGISWIFVIVSGILLIINKKD